MHYLISAAGLDRPGLVAALSRAVGGIGGNIEEASMTRLADLFAVLLLIKVEPGTDHAAVGAALKPVADELGLALSVIADPGSAGEGEEPTHIVNVLAVDRVGLVADVTEAIAAQGGNIVDLVARRLEHTGQPAYTMTVEATFPSGSDPAEALAPLKAQGITVSVRGVDAMTL
ncbi:MAG: hypothetical protein COX57_11500 [Alphaproteobacteria bacterium CG_4_10_14_0_2_um_filter_63_37]|nr:MAG: hypothetical protein AUJ55_03160 [Proteobacteria bacterium CG1_02_64_396]PJA23920.1 MAG: hypothetical protein COX57_11500 [Alphaproteobacteria bacterium CG_4_10_14_0_2_um_filter_63_37]